MYRKKHTADDPAITHFKKRIGIMLHQKRIDKNYTLTAVAQELDISVGKLSGIENGIGSFNLPMISELAHYYGIPIDGLLPSPVHLK